MSGLSGATLTAFRGIQHLLPRAKAWVIEVGSSKTLENFLAPIARTAGDSRTFLDEIYEDIFPGTTRELASWEDQFALPGDGTDAERRDRLKAAWAATGGQSPRYLEDTARAAGFDVYIHDWWQTGTTWTPRDPRSYTDDPLIGVVECGEPLAECGEPTALANAFLVNDPHYIVNKDLTRKPPPVIPSDSTKWPFFIYWGGETFGDYAAVPESKRQDFYELILQLDPSQQWLVTLVDFYDEATTILDQSGNAIQDQDGMALQEQ